MVLAGARTLMAVVVIAKVCVKKKIVAVMTRTSITSNNGSRTAIVVATADIRAKQF